MQSEDTTSAVRHIRTSVTLQTDGDLILEGGRDVAFRSDRTTSEPDQAAWRPKSLAASLRTSRSSRDVVGSCPRIPRRSWQICAVAAGPAPQCCPCHAQGNGCIHLMPLPWRILIALLMRPTCRLNFRCFDADPARGSASSGAKRGRHPGPQPSFMSR